MWGRKKLRCLVTFWMTPASLEVPPRYFNKISVYFYTLTSSLLFLFFLENFPPFCPMWSCICKMWYFKNKISVQLHKGMSLCTKIMQVYCCFLFLFILSFCSSLGLFQRYQIFFFKWYFLLSVLFRLMRIFTATLIPFSFDWTSCPTVPMATPAFSCTSELALYLAGSPL